MATKVVFTVLTVVAEKLRTRRYPFEFVQTANGAEDIVWHDFYGLFVRSVGKNLLALFQTIFHGPEQYKN